MLKDNVFGPVIIYWLFLVAKNGIQCNFIYDSRLLTLSFAKTKDKHSLRFPNSLISPDSYLGPCRWWAHMASRSRSLMKRPATPRSGSLPQTWLAWKARQEHVDHQTTQALLPQQGLNPRRTKGHAIVVKELSEIGWGVKNLGGDQC